MLRKYTLPLAVCVILTGCDVHPVDRTPSSSNVNSIFNTYPFSLELSKDYFVMESTIRPKLIIDGDEYPLGGWGEGLWEFDYPILCKPTTINYSFQINWKYLALIIPVSRQRLDPETGTHSATFPALPPIELTPDELLIYGEARDGPRQEDLVITSQALTPVTIIGVTIGPPSGSCNFGECSGNLFSVAAAPAFPVQLTCSQSTTITISYASAKQDYGTLIIETDRGVFTVPMAGRLFF